MISITLLGLLVLAVIWIIHEERQLHNVVQTSARLITEAEEDRRIGYEAYGALEQGMDEQAENYEQQFLSFEEEIHNVRESHRLLKEDYDEAKKIVDLHEAHCLPILNLEVTGLVQPRAMMIHNHPNYEECAPNNCKADRFADADHVFTDMTVSREPSGG